MDALKYAGFHMQIPSNAMFHIILRFLPMISHGFENNTDHIFSHLQTDTSNSFGNRIYSISSQRKT